MKPLNENLITQRLTLSPPHFVISDSLLSFYTQNKAFHAPFEPLKAELFYTSNSMKDLLKHQIKDQDELRGLYFYLFLQNSNEIIGTIGISNIVYGAFCSAFIGYRLSYSHLHQGYMGEALQAVIDFGSTEYHLHRFEANIMPRNHASIRLAESLGFRFEGYSPEYLQIAGLWEGHNHYAYINQNWIQTEA